ncbi:unnamed protein product [Anisakis simplex]|uniref:Peroxisomal ATPase PEX1 n=1 Tax=Anisakis simplex TaxID=6269 RepID=A0A0M3J271_ANISI|nr:unnamed protein product [Anisakis simplex]
MGNEFRCDMHVFVLAATNRIDLIDEALLRPGRFDYLIECKLPDMEERLSILQVLCRDVKLDSTINLRNIAEATSDYSGADLKGLVTNAQFNAMRHSVKCYKQSNIFYNFINI